MKELVRLTAMGVAVAALLSAATLWTDRSHESTVESTSEELSWKEFCKARGYDVNDKRDEVINEFLDTWRGSIEEEKVFNKLPAIE